MADLGTDPWQLLKDYNINWPTELELPSLSFLLIKIGFAGIIITMIYLLAKYPLAYGGQSANSVKKSIRLKIFFGFMLSFSSVILGFIKYVVDVAIGFY